METWIFKNGRADHMDGYHDDSLTCLAMGLFVMEFSMLRKERDKKRDAVILSSWVVNNSNNTDYDSSKLQDNVSISSKGYRMPIYSMSSAERAKKNMVNAMIMMQGFKNASRNGC